MKAGITRVRTSIAAQVIVYFTPTLPNYYDSIWKAANQAK